MTEREWRASPILGVRSPRRSAEYYRDLLGFSLDPVDGVFQPNPDEPGGVYAIVEREGVRVHFQIRRGDEAGLPRRPLDRDVYVYVADVEGLHAELVSRGARILQPPTTAPYGLREIVVEDLDGHRLAFGEARAGSQAPTATIGPPWRVERKG